MSVKLTQSNVNTTIIFTADYYGLLVYLHDDGGEFIPFNEVWDDEMQFSPDDVIAAYPIAQAGLLVMSIAPYWQNWKGVS